MNFIDLKEQYRLYRSEIDVEIEHVLTSAQFIMGESVGLLEQELAHHCGVKYAIGCGSGTDALLLALMALGVGSGDEVIVPDFTFYATAEMISLLGATPVFVDIKESTYNLDPVLVEAAITQRTKAIIAVSLYGQCADFDELNQIARSRKLHLIEDGAQSFGATYRGRKSCALCEIGTTSFFPSKPLGAYGDGGAVFTSDDELAKQIRILLNHGQTDRYCHVAVGINGRLDTLQAAILRVKLRHFDEECGARQRVAEEYTRALQGTVGTPYVESWNASVWAQYTVRSPARPALVDGLKQKGIPTAIHYPTPLHKQPVYANMRCSDKKFPVTNKICNEVVSLPMHPFLKREEIEQVAAAIRGIK
jgi:UDP-2-acetamido-2-deoxy-ribo-hexuluronate aminotransferase